MHARVSTESHARVSTESHARVFTESQARVSTESHARCPPLQLTDHNTETTLHFLRSPWFFLSPPVER